MPFCINCDNRHGCKGGLPPCLRLERGPDEKRLRGKELMQRRGLMLRCSRCRDFKICWSQGEYEEAIGRSGQVDGTGDTGAE